MTQGNQSPGMASLVSFDYRDISGIQEFGKVPNGSTGNAPNLGIPSGDSTILRSSLIRGGI